MSKSELIGGYVHEDKRMIQTTGGRIGVKTFGEIVKLIRCEMLNMTRADFSRITGIPDITIQKWEYNKSEPPLWNQGIIIDFFSKIFLLYVMDSKAYVFEEVRKFRESLRYVGAQNEWFKERW